MANDPKLKERVITRVKEQPAKEIVISNDGFCTTAKELGLSDVPGSRLKNALNSLAYKEGANPLVRLHRNGQRVYRLRPGFPV